MNRSSGFTLLEILIVVAIISILAAVSIPAYVGMQERGRRAVIERACNANVPELQGWINSVKKGGTILGDNTEVDTNGDGLVNDSDDDNDTIASNGMVETFVNSKIRDFSPWDADTIVWTDGGVQDTQSDCDTAAEANVGQITLCYAPDDNQAIRYLFISATNMLGNTFYSKAISAD